jgi:hypothetical protein
VSIRDSTAFIEHATAAGPPPLATGGVDGRAMGATAPGTFAGARPVPGEGGVTFMGRATAANPLLWAMRGLAGSAMSTTAPGTPAGARLALAGGGGHGVSWV